MRPGTGFKVSRFVWLVLLSALLATGIAALRFRRWQASAEGRIVKVESAVTLQTKGRGGARINFADGATIPTEYSTNLEIFQARPLTLAAGDFDGDGVDDLMSAYATPNGGLLTLHLGNSESIFPGTTRIQPSPFFPAAKTFATLEQPDFLVIGDFNNDGRQDVVTARRDGGALNFFKGDGWGSLQSPERIVLAGKVTALAAGDINRKDGVKDLAVGVVDTDGARVLVFESGHGALPEPPDALVEPASWMLPNAATALDFVSFAADGFGDLAIAAGNEVVVIKGLNRELTPNESDREESASVIIRHDLGSKIEGLTVGRFTDGAADEIVLLTADGDLHSVKQQVSDKTQKVSASKEQAGMPALRSLVVARLKYEGPLVGKLLVRCRVSAGSSTDDLILIDETNRQLRVFGKQPAAHAVDSDIHLAASFESDSEVIAALPMRLNKDGLDDIVFLSGPRSSERYLLGDASGSAQNYPAPSIAQSAPVATFNVNSAENNGDINLNDNQCIDVTGKCTLRAAIQQANFSAGADEIRFNIPGAGPHTITPTNLTFMSSITETLTIDGTTQPGFNGTPLIELNGINAGASVDGLRLATGGINCVLRGLAINRFGGNGIDTSLGNNTTIEANFIGTNASGTAALGNGSASEAAIKVTSLNNTIGGTTAAARNLISGNNGSGVEINSVVSAATGNKIQGNHIGVDISGTAKVGNLGRGIVITRASNNTIGGTATGARNVISGNGADGVGILGSLTDAVGNVVQNNLVGTDKNGAESIANTRNGVLVSGISECQVGGTAAGAGNVISGNTGSGVELRGATKIVVQANRIGTKLNGSEALGNGQHGLLISIAAGNNTIGGSGVTPGTCNGPCNLIAFNAGDGVNFSTGQAILTKRKDEMGPAINVGEMPGQKDPPAGAMNKVQGNSIHDNGGMGINLGEGTVTGGPNNGQKSPQLFDLFVTTDDLTGNVQVDSTTGNSVFPLSIDYYEADIGGNEGQTFLGSTSLAAGDAQKTVMFSLSNVAQLLTSGSAIVATATDANGNTSQFSLSGMPGRCTYTVTPLSFKNVPAAGTVDNSVNVNTQAGCKWNAVTNSAFIKKVTPASFTGPGVVTFGVDAHDGPARQSSLTVAGQAVTVEQDNGCTYTLNHENFEVPAEGRRISINVTTAQTCPWSFKSNSTFISGSDGNSTGSGVVSWDVLPNDALERTGTLTIAGKTVTVKQKGIPSCSSIVSPLDFNVPAAGGKGFKVTITTQPDCKWLAERGSSFIFDVSPSSGFGDGTVTFGVDPSSSPERRGVLRVAGQDITVDQANGCEFGVSPLTFRDVPAAGQQITIEIKADGACGWSASSKSDFITGGGTGKGNGLVTFTVTPNNTIKKRPGTVNVAGEDIPVDQLSNCNFKINPNSFSFGAEGGNGTINVETEAGCEWTAAVDSQGTVDLTGGANGTGPGKVLFAVTGNPGSNERSAKVTVAGQAVNVLQSACTYTFNLGNSHTFSAAGGTLRGNLETNSPSCKWFATRPDFVTVVPRDGAGSAAISITTFPNSTVDEKAGFVKFSFGPSIKVVQLTKNAGLDFDGDNKADLGKVGTSNNSPEPPKVVVGLLEEVVTGITSDASAPEAQVSWVITSSADGSQRVAKFGLDTDNIVPGDYNGDGTSDLAVWRSSNATWFIAKPAGIPAENFDAIQFGLSSDIPVQADYDGDGKTDIAVFRPSDGDWRILQSIDNQVRIVHLGSGIDKLVPGDYDGDGHADIAVWQPANATWNILQSSNNSNRVIQFGLSNDKPAPGDYDGDFKTDIAVFRHSDGTWRILRSSDNSALELKLGLADDVLVPADYDGDLMTDAAVFRPSDGSWRILRSSDGTQQIKQFGQRGDVPIPSALFPQPTWQSAVLTNAQTEIKTWTVQGRTFAYVKLAFPNGGFRAVNFGSSVRSGNDFSADASLERFTGPSVLAVTTTAKIYDLGPLADGDYTFTFKNSGALVKSQAFTVSSAISPPNSIDDARQFVKQQYRDFLNREADQAGEDFWTDNITKCNDPARRPAGQTVEQCTLRQRETTSGAFFLSPEFQYTGYYVLRMYQGALGRQPKLSEFVRDVQFVGNGIVVNGQLSAAVINQNKAAFAVQFQNCTDATKSRCAEFKAIYDGLNNTQYVDKLFETTGINASASDRVDLVNSIGANQTRASVLQKIVDGINVISEGNQQFTTTYGKAFYDQQFTSAFVQLEYFGYMKRDPDEAGYAFWLGKLNQFGGNFVNAEMVLAFITSPEYRARFGQP